MNTEPSLIIFDNKTSRCYIELFKKDKKGLASFWHHGDNEFHMLDSYEDIKNGVKILIKQGARFNETIEKNDFMLINLQHPESTSQPPVDPLANCLGYCISGFVFVVKKECWSCRKPIKKVTLCNTCHMEFYCCNTSCSKQKSECNMGIL